MLLAGTELLRASVVSVKLNSTGADWQSEAPSYDALPIEEAVVPTWSDDKPTVPLRHDPTTGLRRGQVIRPDRVSLQGNGRVSGRDNLIYGWDKPHSRSDNPRCTFAAKEAFAPGNLYPNVSSAGTSQNGDFYVPATLTGVNSPAPLEPCPAVFEFTDSERHHITLMEWEHERGDDIGLSNDRVQRRAAQTF